MQTQVLEPFVELDLLALFAPKASPIPSTNNNASDEAIFTVFSLKVCESEMAFVYRSTFIGCLRASGSSLKMKTFLLPPTTLEQLEKEIPKANFLNRGHDWSIRDQSFD